MCTDRNITFSKIELCFGVYSVDVRSMNWSSLGIDDHKFATTSYLPSGEAPYFSRTLSRGKVTIASAWAIDGTCYTMYPGRTNTTIMCKDHATAKTFVDDFIDVVVPKEIIRQAKREAQSQLQDGRVDPTPSRV
jgi:hypothetical protein